MRCRSYFWRFACLLLCFGGVVRADMAQAATLHAIIVGHTDDFTIGTGIQCNVEHMNSFLTRVALVSGLSLSTQYFVAGHFDSSLVKTYLENLSVTQDDVVFYYQACHGFRTGQMSESWPALSFGDNCPPMRLQAVVDQIQALSPRFSLVIADCCNRLCDREFLVVAQQLESERCWKGLRHLFCDYTGMIVAASAQPGEPAWYRVESGGLYTLAFLDSMKDAIHSGKPDWSSILDDVSEKIKQKFLHRTQKQHPIASVQISRLELN